MASVNRASFPSRRIIPGNIEQLEQRLLLASQTLFADVNDRGVDLKGGGAAIADAAIRVGDTGGNTTERAAVYPFKLPALPAGAVITSATASFTLKSLNNASSLIGNVDVYGLGRRASASVVSSDFFEGAWGTDSTNATNIQTSLATKSTAPSKLSLNASGNTALKSYLQAQYANGAGANQFVFLRLNPQAAQPSSAFWVFYSTEAGQTAQKPTLTITYDVPAAPTAPTAPAGLVLTTRSNASIGLAWQDKSSNETNFIVQRSTNGTTYSNVATLAANSTSFIDSGLAADALYYYRVYATNAGVNSSPSPVASTSSLPTFTRTVWVDTNYSGATQNGAFATPFKTIAQAMTGAVPGDGIVLRGGTYRENVTMKSGTPGSPITLMSQPSERAIISGFEALSGWTLHAGNVYKTTLNWKPDTLYIKNDPMDISRSPNEGWWVAPTVTQDTVNNVTIVSDPAHLAGVPSLVGGHVYAHTVAGNNYAGNTILAHDTVAGKITIVRTNTLASGDRYMVKNTTNLLDRAGEWAVVTNPDSTYTVFFWPRAVADLSNTQSRKLASRQVYAGSAGHDIVLRGLEITGNKGYGVEISGGTTNKANNVILRDSVIHNNGSNGVWIRYATNITVRNNISMANTGTGIAMGSSSGVVVERNEVAYNNVDGVVVAGDVSGRKPGDAGYTPTSNVIVSNNYIHHHLGYSHTDGIQMYRGVSDVHVLNNFVLNNSQGLMTEEVDGGELGGNIFWNAAGFIVIFGHSNSNNWNVHNNTIGGSGYGAYNITGVGNNMRENITYTAVSIPSIAGSAYTGDYNLYFNPVSSTPLRTASPSKNYSSIATFYADTGQDQHSAIGNPQFNNGPALATVMEDIQKSTTTTLHVRSVTGFAVGDKIQINSDGVMRTVTAIDVAGKLITFDKALPARPLVQYLVIENWKTATNFALNLGLKSTSPGKTMGPTGGQVGALFNTTSYIAGDFTGDGKRDIPPLASDIVQGLPDPNNWPPPSF